MTQPPPPIQFGPWTPQGETSTSRIFEFKFPSPIVTGIAENDVVTCYAYLPKAPGKYPAVIVLHYWGAPDRKVESALARELNIAGIAAILVALPYHLERAPPGTRSGELAIEPDPQAMIRTMTQATMDVRRAIDWIGTQNELMPDKVGIAGTSLGAVIASVIYAVDLRIRAACFLLGGVDLAHIIWNSPLVVNEKDKLRQKGFDEARLRESLKSIEPAELLKARAGGDAYVIAARYDTIIPIKDGRKLIEVLGQPHVSWLDTGHYGGFIAQKPINKAVTNYFSAEFEGEPYRAPTRFFAPTLRLGLQYNPSTSLQIGLGIDLWRSDPSGTYFAALMATPRGGQLFLGRTLGRGFSAGAVILRRSTTYGVFWSTVL